MQNPNPLEPIDKYAQDLEIATGYSIADEEYQVRGFGSFGNNPGNGYTTELYTQQGAPRTAGLTVTYDF